MSRFEFSSSENNEKSEKQASKEVSSNCLTPQDMLKWYGLKPDHGVKISPLNFLLICPALVYELDQHSCYESNEAIEMKMFNDNATNWLYAFISVTIISAAGLFGVVVVPLAHNKFYEQFLQFLIALAVGTLTGDALLHLLPHAMINHSSLTNQFSYINRPSSTIASILFFYILESVLRIIKKKYGHSHSHSHSFTLKNEKTNSQVIEEEHFVIEAEHLSRKLKDIQKNKTEESDSYKWMVIIGDGLHNITDGMAIGAAFISNTIAGISTSIAVLCHELPHEIGDFAVLLQSGMSIKKAVSYNILSSFLSFLGLVLGLYVGHFQDASSWVYAITAGTFLYISLADLIPEMQRYAEKTSSISTIVLHTSGIATGNGIMLAIAYYEESLEKWLQQ